MWDSVSFMTARPKPGFVQALPPVLVLSALIVYGLVVRPLFLGESAFPLEVIFSLSAGFTIAELFWLGYSWADIQDSIVRKLARATPAFFILMAIGVIISSWMVCGALPMMVYYGLRLLNPDYIYLAAFLVPVVFSTLTGTSWGSAGTVGVVIIGIASALQADLGITAGAVIGGAFFGDKLSPLSDTTNMAGAPVFRAPVPPRASGIGTRYSPVTSRVSWAWVSPMSPMSVMTPPSFRRGRS